MIEFEVPDMTCSHCAGTLTKAVKALDSGAEVEVLLETHRLRVRSSASRAAIEAAIRDAGYTPKPL
jgi:copper chaperone